MTADGSIVITSEKPAIEGSAFPVLIATLQPISGFAGDARDNADYIVNAANHHDGLLTRLREIESACLVPYNAERTVAHVCALARTAIDEVSR